MSETDDGRTIPVPLPGRETWLLWHYEDDRKLPIAPYYQSGYEGQIPPVSAQDEQAWTDLDTARQLAAAMSGWNLALNIRDRDEYPDEDLVLIDLDDVRDPLSHKLHPRAEEIINSAGSYAQVSTSGTGAHVLIRAPEGLQSKSIKDDLPDHPDFPDAEIEVYDSARYVGFTGNHIESTPAEVKERQAWLADLEEQHVTEPSGTPDKLSETTAADFSDEHVENIDVATSKNELFAALRRVRPRDIRINSSATNERSDGTVSLDPSWEQSKSGTRLAMLDDGFVYRNGMIGLDPLHLVALEERIVSDPTTYPSGEEFWEAVDALRRRGADVPEYEPAAAPPKSGLAFLPDVAVDAGSEVDDPLTQSELQDLVYDDIKSVMQGQDRAVIDAIMSSGKTYGSIKAAADLDQPAAYFAPRLDLYDQAETYAREVGIPDDEILKLPSIQRDCPTWQGEHGDEWEQKVKALYYRGVQPKTLHTLLDLPCTGDEHDDDLCHYEERWQAEFDDYQLIIGHYKHAHLPIVTGGRHLIFDEEVADAYSERLAGSELAQSINTFLSFAKSPPVDSFDAALRQENKSQVLAWFDRPEWDWEPDQRNVVRLAERSGEAPDYHALAPHALYTIYTASSVDSDNDDYPFRLTTIPGANNRALHFATSEQEGERYVEVRMTPELSYAQSVVALDGTPLVRKLDSGRSVPGEWQRALGVDLEHRRILQDPARKQYLRDTLNHTYVQTSPHVKPYSSGNYANPEEDAALLHGVRETFGDGDPPLVFTPKTVAESYTDMGFIEQGLADEFNWPGNIRGTDRYGSERVLVQLGSTHHGDHELRRRAAWLRTPVYPEGKGRDRDYGSGVGRAVYRQMAEAQTLQNVLRVGRDGGGAIVVLHTSVFPDWLPVESRGVVDLWPDGARAIIDAADSIWRPDREGPVETADVVDGLSAAGVDYSEQHVRRLLGHLSQAGLIDTSSHPDDGRKNVYEGTGVTEVAVTAAADVDLPDDHDFRHHVESDVPTTDVLLTIRDMFGVVQDHRVWSPWVEATGPESDPPPEGEAG